MLDSDGFLSIFGQGAMYDYKYAEYAPWHDYCSDITCISVGEGITHIGEMAFYFCESAWKVNLPTSLKSIGKWAFWDCKTLESISIPDNVEKIGESAFENCYKLGSISIPDNVYKIDSCAFRFCYNLKHIDLPESLKEISFECFRGTAIEEIEIPEGVTYISTRAFASCTKLKELILPDSLEGIGMEFIKNSGITKITIPSNVTQIDEYAFYEDNSNVEYKSKLEHIEVSKNNQYYSSEDGVLYNKEKTKLLAIPKGKRGEYIVPETVEDFNDYVFSYCKNLTSVTLNNNFTEIPYRMFTYCTDLEYVYIPDSVKNIEKEAFL